MQLIKRENFMFEFRIESLEDLWILSQFITYGDKIFSRTQRKVKVGGESSTKQVSKIIFVELEVRKTSFEGNVLRLSGEILNETEFTAIGQYHTLSFSVNDKIKVFKRNLLSFEETLLEKALTGKKLLNLIVLMDKDELVAIEFGDFSYSVLFEKAGLGSKKYVIEEIDENEQKFSLIENLLKRDYSQVIFAGPGHWKESLKKYVKDRIGKDVLSFSFNEVNSSCVQKMIKMINESGIVTQSQLGMENKIISKLLENINKGKKYSYGYENVSGDIMSGKVEMFLVSTKFIDKKKEDNSYLELNGLMMRVEELNGKLVIVNSNNESGKILDGLGGIASILRY